MLLNMINAVDGREFCTIAARRGLLSISLASQGRTLLISLYDSSVASAATGTAS